MRELKEFDGDNKIVTPEMIRFITESLGADSHFFIDYRAVDTSLDTVFSVVHDLLRYE